MLRQLEESTTVVMAFNRLMPSSMGQGIDPNHRVLNSNVDLKFFDRF